MLEPVEKFLNTTGTLGQTKVSETVKAETGFEIVNKSGLNTLSRQP